MSHSFRFCLLCLSVLPFAGFHCVPDVVVPPPTDLTNQYIGTYTRQVVDTDSSIYVPILWNFDTDRFEMRFDWEHYVVKDSSRVPNELKYCQWEGEYKIDIGIELTPPAPNGLDSSRTFRTCDSTYSPYGTYVLDQSTRNQITMSSLTQNPQGKTVVRIIHLIRKQ